MNKKILEIDNLKKSFNNQEILKGISFDVYQGEFLSLLDFFLILNSTSC